MPLIDIYETLFAHPVMKAIGGLMQDFTSSGENFFRAYIKPIPLHLINRRKVLFKRIIDPCHGGDVTESLQAKITEIRVKRELQKGVYKARGRQHRKTEFFPINIFFMYTNLYNKQFLQLFFVLRYNALNHVLK